MSDWSAGDASAMARTRPEEFSCCGRKQGLLRALQYLNRQCRRDRRKAFEKFFQRVVALQVFKQILNGYARSLEHRSAAKDIGINRDEIRRTHEGSLFLITPSRKSLHLCAQTPPPSLSFPHPAPPLHRSLSAPRIPSRPG